MSTLKADTIQNTSGGAATLTKQSAAKHFVIYDNSDSSRAIQNSLNCSSLSDLATGQTSISYTNNFSNVHYTSGGNPAWNGGDVTTSCLQNAATSKGDITTSAIEISTRYANASAGALFDYEYSPNVSLGDLA